MLIVFCREDVTKVSSSPDIKVFYTVCGLLRSPKILNNPRTSLCPSGELKPLIFFDICMIISLPCLNSLENKNRGSRKEELKILKENSSTK